MAFFDLFKKKPDKSQIIQDISMRIIEVSESVVSNLNKDKEMDLDTFFSVFAEVAYVYCHCIDRLVFRICGNEARNRIVPEVELMTVVFLDRLFRHSSHLSSATTVVSGPEAVQNFFVDILELRAPLYSEMLDIGPLPNLPPTNCVLWEASKLIHQDWLNDTNISNLEIDILLSSQLLVLDSLLGGITKKLELLK